MPRIVTISAPAKLNLALSVGPPENDPNGRGLLHPICSWMATIDLMDDLEVTRLDDDHFSRYAILWHDDAPRRSDIDWKITHDLAVRAHQALESHAGRTLPVQLKLEKRIPVGGGLGGGSANAAAMLHAVNALFALDLDDAELAAIGATLGSDIPFLIHGGSGIVSGYGERIDHHDTPRALPAVLILPDATCPTGEVYDQYDDLGPVSLREDDVRRLAAAERPELFNDLGAAALQIAPELVAVRDAVASLAECEVHVTGSGAALFVLCDDTMHAEHLAEAINEQLELPPLNVTTGAPRVLALEETS